MYFVTTTRKYIIIAVTLCARNVYIYSRVEASLDASRVEASLDASRVEGSDNKWLILNICQFHVCHVNISQ